VLSSVVKHTGSRRARKKCIGKTRDVVECFSLQLIFFYDEEYNNFLTHLAEFSNQTLFSKRVKVASAMLCSLVKYANISQSQSLLELFKQFEWLTGLELSFQFRVVSSGVREKNDAFKVRFLVDL